MILISMIIQIYRNKELSPDAEIILIFRTEFFSWFYIVALKKNVLLREKTKDAFLRPMFPHISDSIFCGYLTGISSVLSGSPISVTPAIF